MIRRFFRHLGESIKNLKRNLLSTLTAVFSVIDCSFHFLGVLWLCYFKYAEIGFRY